MTHSRGTVGNNIITTKNKCKKITKKILESIEFFKSEETNSPRNRVTLVFHFFGTQWLKGIGCVQINFVQWAFSVSSQSPWQEKLYERAYGNCEGVCDNWTKIVIVIFQNPRIQRALQTTDGSFSVA